MTARQMGVTTSLAGGHCGHSEPVHREPELSTAAIHPSYTEHRVVPPATTGFFHRIHRPYYNDETYNNGSSPEYLGTEQLLTNHRQGTGGNYRPGVGQ